MKTAVNLDTYSDLRACVTRGTAFGDVSALKGARVAVFFAPPAVDKVTIECLFN